MTRPDRTPTTPRAKATMRRMKIDQPMAATKNISGFFVTNGNIYLEPEKELKGRRMAFLRTLFRH